jgi:hypothetical protein
MLNDFVYLDSQIPVPTCRHMAHCSLSLYLGGCASCEFLDRADQNPESDQSGYPDRRQAHTPRQRSGVHFSN